MTKLENNKIYNLEERTFQFAQNTRQFVRKIPKTLSNQEDSRQLVRASGSVGANYIEANEALSKNDFKHRIKISRKESKESVYWLKLVYVGNSHELEIERTNLSQEATELMKIFSAIMRKSS